MITGAHVVIFSTHPEADRAFLRDVLKLNHVDAGDGWLIFGLPPSEVAVHPSEKNDLHELYLLSDDIGAFVAEMARQNISCGPVEEQSWGSLARVTLPGGGRLGIYEPRHARPHNPPRKHPRTKSGRRTRARGRSRGRMRPARKKAAR